MHMGQFFTDLWAFILAVLNNWITLMSGGILTVLLALWERHRKKNIPPKWYWALIAFFFVLLATFFAWREEHAKFDKTQKELADAKDQNAPRLSSQIEKVVIGEGADVKETQVFIFLAVRNVGDHPSIAEKYKLRIHTGNFEYIGEPKKIPKEYLLTPANKTEKIIIRHEDSLDEKTATPIDRGDLKRGWLRFIVSSEVKPDSIQQPGMKFTVSFTDVSGKSYQADYNLPENVK